MGNMMNATFEVGGVHVSAFVTGAIAIGLVAIGLVWSVGKILDRRRARHEGQ